MPVGRRILIIFGSPPAADADRVSEREGLVIVERSVEPDFRDMLGLRVRRHVAARLVVALGVLGVVLWLIVGSADAWLAAGLWHRLARLAGTIFAGVLAYFATLYALGFRLRDFNRSEEH